jgi:transaldolase
MVTGTKGEAQQVLDDLERVGISYDDVVDVLEKEGVEKFEASWTELVAGVKQELEAAKSAL